MMVKDTSLEETARGQGLTDNDSHEIASASNSVHDQHECKSNIYNILLIGPSQSGKSTLVEAIGQYLFPGSEIDFSHIGDGNLSCTKEVRVVEYESHFPEFELINTDPTSQVPGEVFYLPKQKTSSGIKINVPRFLDEKSHRKYKQKLNQYDDLEVYQAPPGSQKRHIFRIYDTPGLEDTDGEDVKNVANILEAVTKTDKFHLVLVTISIGTHLSPGLQTALEDFRNMFSDMGGLFAFVHTKADFLSMHPEERDFNQFLENRGKSLDEIMGREIPYFVINSYLKEDRPVCVYLRQRVIRGIFSLARLNVPVPVDRIQLAKTKQMRTIDSSVIEACNWHLKDIERKQAEFLAKLEAIKAGNSVKIKNITNLSFLAERLRSDIREKEEELSCIDTDDLDFLAEKTSAQYGWWVFDIFGRLSTKLEVSNLPYTIDEIHEDNPCFVIESVEGGRGHNYWTAWIKRNAWSDGTLHFKFYAKRRNKNQGRISNLKQDLLKQKEDLEVLVNAMTALEVSGPNEDDPEITEERMQIQTEQSKLLQVISRAKQGTLHPKLFKAIAEAGVYEGDPEKTTTRVTEFYAEYVLADAGNASN